MAYAVVEHAPAGAAYPVPSSYVEAAIHACAWNVVRFLVLELPGGSRWWPLLEALPTAAEVANTVRNFWHDGNADNVQAHAKLRVEQRRRRVWRRRRTLLLTLRALRDEGRAEWWGGRQSA